MSSSVFREVSTQAAISEKKKLRKNLRYFDMIFFTLAAIVNLDTLGAFSANGIQALIWLILGAATFFIPYGMMSAELGSTFTQEGGIYVWCKMAGGRFFAAVGSMLYWISNPLWLGGTLSVGAIAAIKTFWFGSLNYQFGGSTNTDALVEIVIALLFIWGTTWIAILSLGFGKWFATIGTFIKLGLLSVFIIMSTAFLIGGHSSGNSLILANALPGSWNWGIILSVLLPVIVFQFIGFETQNSAGEEMQNPQRDVPRSLIRAGVLAIVSYGLFLVFILLALPPSQLSNVGSFFTAFQSVVGVLPDGVAKVLGFFIAGAFVISLASTGGTWIMAADRTYAISALDRTAPSIFGRFSARFGTPIFVNIMSGTVASITMIIAVIVQEFFASGNLATFFGLVLGFSISTSTLSYLFMFPAFLILRYKYANVHRPYKVPGGMVGAWIVMVLPLIYVAVASFFLIYPAQSSVDLAGVSRTTYEITQIVPFGVIVLLTTVFYLVGQNEKKNQDVMVDVNAETGAEVIVGGLAEE